MTFYKYLPAGFAIQAIQNEFLKVGIANQQNDIFDCYPIIQAGEAPNEQEDKLLTEETLEQMSAWYGIVSFCEEPDNLLLWAHYGDSHRGIALGIQFDAENEPIKVEYLPENKRRTIRKDQIERIADERKAEGLREPNYCKRDYCRDCISSEISPTSLTADDRWN